MATAIVGLATQYLSRIPNNSLISISEFIGSIGQRSTFLATWMAETVTDELHKRKAILNEAEVPHEPARPHFPINVPPRELAGVLESLHLSSYAINCPFVGNWIDEILNLTICQTAITLREHQLLIDKIDQIGSVK